VQQRLTGSHLLPIVHASKKPSRLAACSFFSLLMGIWAPDARPCQGVSGATSRRVGAEAERGSGFASHPPGRFLPFAPMSSASLQHPCRLGPMDHSFRNV
jgi:hypothetical protein